MMKFKLGLLLGGVIGYLIGSGKGAQMWADYRARARGESDPLAFDGSVMDFTDPAVLRVTESFVSTSDVPLSNDR